MRSSLNTQILRWIFLFVLFVFFFKKIVKFDGFFRWKFSNERKKNTTKNKQNWKNTTKTKKKFSNWIFFLKIFLVFVWESGKWRDSLEKDLTKKFEWNSKKRLISKINFEKSITLKIFFDFWKIENILDHSFFFFL